MFNIFTFFIIAYLCSIKKVNFTKEENRQCPYFPSSLSISRVYVMRSLFRPSPHFSFRLLCPAPAHSRRGGLGGRARVVNFCTELNEPTPIPFTACTRTLMGAEFCCIIKCYT